MESGFRKNQSYGDAGRIALVRGDVDALRTVRGALIDLAYDVSRRTKANGYLVLVDTGITRARLEDEWRRARAILRPEVGARLAIALPRADGTYDGIPAPPPEDAQRWLNEVVQQDVDRPGGRTKRIDFEFVIVKLLLHEWLTRRGPVTTTWLSAAAGCSYPTVARALKSLGKLVERHSDRSVSLASFPRQEFSRLLAKSDRERGTVRFVDQSGQPRTAESHLGRLENLRPAGVAIGGVAGARHYLPELDLVGLPRLDLSVHCPDGRLDLGLMKALDPALRREDDPQKPASVVVHAVRHVDPLFTPRAGGLSWADPVECLLDLYEARLEAQGAQFIDELSNRPAGSMA